FDVENAFAKGGPGIETNGEFAPVVLQIVGFLGGPRFVVGDEGEDAGLAGFKIGAAFETVVLALEKFRQAAAPEVGGRGADVGGKEAHAGSAGRIVDVEADAIVIGLDRGVVGIGQDEDGGDVEDEFVFVLAVAGDPAGGDGGPAEGEPGLGEHGVDAVLGGGLGLRGDGDGAVEVGERVQLLPGGALLVGGHDGGGDERVGDGLWQIQRGAVVGEGLREGEGEVALEAAASLVGQYAGGGRGDVVETRLAHVGRDAGVGEAGLLDVQDLAGDLVVDGEVFEAGHAFDGEALRGHEAEGGRGVGTGGHRGGGRDVGIDEVDAGLDAFVADPPSVFADEDVAAGGAGSGDVGGGDLDIDEGRDDVVVFGTGDGARGDGADEQHCVVTTDGDGGVDGGGGGDVGGARAGGIVPGGGGGGDLAEGTGGGGHAGGGVEVGFFVAADEPLQADGGGGHVGGGVGLRVGGVAPDAGPFGGAGGGRGAIDVGGGGGALIGAGVFLQFA